MSDREHDAAAAESMAQLQASVAALERYTLALLAALATGVILYTRVLMLRGRD